MKKFIAGTVATAAFVVAGLVVSTPANAGIQLWDYLHYGGGYLGDFGRGTNWVGANANDKASSVAVSQPANYAILYDHADRQGAQSPTFYTGTDDLRYYGFNDITSSIG
ncbi:hypothetical protein [Microbacterium trichothecenolyticum]|nr:hypothetical protein [Microbacterium trichothecenolyticum]